MKGLALIKLHTVLLWQPESPKGKFFTDIPTPTDENVAEQNRRAEVKDSNIKLRHDVENRSKLCSNSCEPTVTWSLIKLLLS